MIRWSCSVIAFRAAGPQGVDDGLDVLLVHDEQVVVDVVRHVLVARRVVEGHDQAGAGERGEPGRAVEPAGRLSIVSRSGSPTCSVSASISAWTAAASARSSCTRALWR